MAEVLNQTKSFYLRTCFVCGLDRVESDNEKFLCRPKVSKIGVCCEECVSQYADVDRKYDDLFALESFSARFVALCNEFNDTESSEVFHEIALASVEFRVYVEGMQKLEYDISVRSCQYYLAYLELMARCTHVLTKVKPMDQSEYVSTQFVVDLYYSLADMLQHLQRFDDALRLMQFARDFSFERNDAECQSVLTIEVALLAINCGRYEEVHGEDISINTVQQKGGSVTRKLARIRLGYLRSLKRREQLGETLLSYFDMMPHMVRAPLFVDVLDVLKLFQECVASVVASTRNWKTIETIDKVASVAIGNAKVYHEYWGVQHTICAYRKEVTMAALILNQSTVSSYYEQYRNEILRSDFSKQSLQYADFYFVKALVLEKKKRFDEAVKCQMLAISIYRFSTFAPKSNLEASYKALERHMYLLQFKSQ